MKLPVLLSVPHAGLRVPAAAAPYCQLTADEIARDGDEGAAAIYALEAEVAAFVTTDIARAIVDMNRSENDRRTDGVVKTHTCWNIPVYRTFPPEDVIEQLLAHHYRPYHRRLAELAGLETVRVGIDAHTMAASGPPIGPDPGAHRPEVCLSYGDGTCPQAWIEMLARCFEREFDEVRINDPFKGGYITRTYAARRPWLQLELSRAPFASSEQKRAGVLAALRAWCAEIFGSA